MTNENWVYIIWLLYGPVAQLGAHHIRIVGVVGSNPIRSTKNNPRNQNGFGGLNVLKDNKLSLGVIDLLLYAVYAVQYRVYCWLFYRLSWHIVEYRIYRCV